MPIQLYSNRFMSTCRAVLMTAKELNIEMNLINIDISEGEHKKPEFVQINPTGSLPTLDDNGFILWDQGPIMQYLCNQYAPDSALYPKDTKARAIVDRWLSGDMIIKFSMKDALFSSLMTGVEASEDKIKSFKTIMKILDQLIGGNKYLAGNQLTIADLAILTNISVLYQMEYDMTDYPNTNRWYLSLAVELPYFDEINKFDKTEAHQYMEKVKAFVQQDK